MNDILLTAIRDALLPEIRQIIREEIKASRIEDLTDKYISPDVVCAMFEPKVSRTTLYNWDKDGRINSYLIGGRRLYKHSEVIQAVEKLKKYTRSNGIKL